MAYSSASPRGLAEVNSNLSIKKYWDKEEEYLNDWKLRARSDKDFLERLTKELSNINRLDLIQELLNDPLIKRSIKKGSSKEYELLLPHHKSKATLLKSKCCIGVCSLLIVLLIVLLVFSVLQTLFMIDISGTALYKAKEADRIVGEGDSVSTYTLDKKDIKTIQISEKVEKGDSKHSITLVLVPTAKLEYDKIYNSESWNATAYVPDFPIINDIYVYLNARSKVNFDIWIGNGRNKKSATLYIFDDIDNLNDYIRYSEVNSPVFTKEVPVEGKNGTQIPQSYLFTSPADGYYYFILLSPEANIQFSYSINTTELVTDVDQYTSDYPSCVIDTERNCTLTTSNAKHPSSEDLTLLAAASTKYDISSKITHLHLKFTDRSYLMTLPSIIFGVTVGVALLILIIFLVIGVSVVCMKRKSRRAGYVAIN